MVLVLAILGLVAASALSSATAQEQGDRAADSDTAVTPVFIPPDEAPDGEALEDSPAEPLKGQLLHDFRDARVVKVEDDAAMQVSDVLAEINGLANGNDEPALQWVIEQIKKDAEVTRLNILLEDAEDQGDDARADAIRGEIEHLSTLDEPVRGIPQEQAYR
jgi:hypothetical protein